MSYVQRLTVTVVTASDGSATAFSDSVTGFLDRIAYVKTDFANGVGFTITLESTGETLWAESDVNASAVRAPRQPTHSTAGAAALYASGGAAVLAPIAIAADRVKIVIASGGAVKTGTFHILVA